MAEAGEHELLSEPAALIVGVDGDDVDLAQLLLLVHLRPAEAGEVLADLVQEEAFGIEPVLAPARSACRASRAPARDDRETPGC